jgi:hypothetical protein
MYAVVVVACGVEGGKGDACKTPTPHHQLNTHSHTKLSFLALDAAVGGVNGPERIGGGSIRNEAAGLRSLLLAEGRTRRGSTASAAPVQAAVLRGGSTVVGELAAARARVTSAKRQSSAALYPAAYTSQLREAAQAADDAGTALSSGSAIALAGAADAECSSAGGAPFVWNEAAYVASMSGGAGGSCGSGFRTSGGDTQGVPTACAHPSMCSRTNTAIHSGDDYNHIPVATMDSGDSSGANSSQCNSSDDGGDGRGVAAAGDNSSDDSDAQRPSEALRRYPCGRVSAALPGWSCAPRRSGLGAAAAAAGARLVSMRLVVDRADTMEPAGGAGGSKASAQKHNRGKERDRDSISSSGGSDCNGGTAARTSRYNQLPGMRRSLVQPPPTRVVMPAQTSQEISRVLRHSSSNVSKPRATSLMQNRRSEFAAARRASRTCIMATAGAKAGRASCSSGGGASDSDSDERVTVSHAGWPAAYERAAASSGIARAARRIALARTQGVQSTAGSARRAAQDAWLARISRKLKVHH